MQLLSPTCAALVICFPTRIRMPLARIPPAQTLGILRPLPSCGHSNWPASQFSGSAHPHAAELGCCRACTATTGVVCRTATRPPESEAVRIRTLLSWVAAEQPPQQLVLRAVHEASLVLWAGTRFATPSCPSKPAAVVVHLHCSGFARLRQHFALQGSRPLHTLQLHQRAAQPDSASQLCSCMTRITS